MEWLNKYFKVITEKQTYLNIVYLAFAFPLGLAYFIFLVTGLSLGIGLVIIWVGLLVLLLVYAIWYGLLVVERYLANLLLNADIPPMLKQDLSGKTIWQKFTTTMQSPVTWKGLFFLFMKFPIGLFSFVVLVTLGSIAFSLISAPIYYNWFPAHVNVTFDRHAFNSFWLIDTLPEAIVICILGLLITPLFLTIFNFIATLSAKFAQAMLSDSTQPVDTITDGEVPVEINQDS
ncbi:MAG: sensor domain-containing protein [Anaerolineaceae bacterium]|nr:sensor domain-containing protein [Anaerolineaceae bacterium]